MEKVLVIAAHPDDETLGCAGTLLKHKTRGDKIYWLIMTNISDKEGYAKVKVQERQREIELVNRKYGFKRMFKLNFPTAKLDVIQRSQMIKTVSGIIYKVNPSVIYLPNRNDVHSDHKVTFDAVFSAIKTFRAPFIKKILMYEVISETEFSPAFKDSAFTPNSFSDITKFMKKKISIMKIYKGELGKHPFPRSIENIKSLAVCRGAASGVKYAEAFMVLKEIW